MTAPQPSAKAHGQIGGQPGALLGRAAGLFLVLMAVLWMVRVGPATMDFSRADLYAVGEAIRLGESFSPETIRIVADQSQHLVAGQPCMPWDAENLVLLRIAQVEAAFVVNNEDAADQALMSAETAAKQTIYCAPNSSLAWIALAWIDFVRNDHTPHFRALIQMSERVGPNEGWSVTHRVELMLRLLSKANEADLVSLRRQIEAIIDEEGFHFLAAIYLSGDSAQQKYLRTIFADARENGQKRLAGIIRVQGGDIDLPLVAPLGGRPWDR